MGHVGVESDIGNAGLLTGEETALAQLLFHHAKQGMGTVDCADSVHLGAKHRGQARRGRPGMEWAGGGREPTLHPGLPDRVARQPFAAAIGAGQINQDRIGVGQYRAAVINHRHLAKAVQGGEELRRFMRTLLEVHQDKFTRQPQQGQHQFDPVGVAGQGKTIEFDRRLGHDRLQMSGYRRQGCSTTAMSGGMTRIHNPAFHPAKQSSLTS